MEELLEVTESYCSSRVGHPAHSMYSAWGLSTSNFTIQSVTATSMASHTDTHTHTHRAHSHKKTRATHELHTQTHAPHTHANGSCLSEYKSALQSTVKLTVRSLVHIDTSRSVNQREESDAHTHTHRGGEVVWEGG